MEYLITFLPAVFMAMFFCHRYFKTRKIIKLLPELKKRGAQIIDVRSEAEFASGHNPSSINIPLDDFKNRMNKIEKDTPVVVCCASGTRSAIAGHLLKGKGFEVYNAGKWSNTL